MPTSTLPGRPVPPPAAPTAYALLVRPLGVGRRCSRGPRVTIPLGPVLSASAVFGMVTWTVDSSCATMRPPYIARGLDVGIALPATAAAITVTGNAPVKDGDVASGLQSTMLVPSAPLCWSP
ncbi:hypothetical protein ACFU8Q_04950 [Streptomyces sp. NPDC057543]|uniref:hypothetical protein n=1 Tax=Streptomyces sp. NPDC057543 TaxID=3346163 RepID=UPI0036BAEF8D